MAFVLFIPGPLTCGWPGWYNKKCDWLLHPVPQVISKTTHTLSISMYYECAQMYFICVTANPQVMVGIQIPNQCYPHTWWNKFPDYLYDNVLSLDAWCVHLLLVVTFQYSKVAVQNPSFAEEIPIKNQECIMWLDFPEHDSIKAEATRTPMCWALRNPQTPLVP